MKNNFCDFWQVQAELWLIYVVYVYHNWIFLWLEPALSARIHVSLQVYVTAEILN